MTNRCFHVFAQQLNEHILKETAIDVRLRISTKLYTFMIFMAPHF